MRIQCPFCDTAYEVPSHRLSGRSVLRCTVCGGSFAVPDPPPPPQTPQEPAPPAPLAAPLAAPSAMVPEPRPVPPPPDRLLQAAWGMSVALVVGALALLLAEHRAMAQLWPPLRRLYGAIGLA